MMNQNFINNDAAVPGLNRNQAYSLSLLVPTQDVLESFDDHAVPIFRHVNLLRQKNQNLRQTRDLLLPKLISGEIDITDMEIAA
jgi:type I restriction enzyme S subunit